MPNAGNESWITELEHVAPRLKATDESFAFSLCKQYHEKGYLSEKQWYWVNELRKRAGAESRSTGGAKEYVEAIFDGHEVRALLDFASQKLKFPKLRYKTDGGSTVVFSFATNGKWKGCTFISNGAKGENKKRYGFIDSVGFGKLDSSSQPEIQTAIRKIAADPRGAAKLQGQRYSNCCFCGLELTNKSSLHHGYGPICAGNWGLPWGDTGDGEDEEAAAQEELKHIQLTDLE